jgi:hypothetical protein
VFAPKTNTEGEEAMNETDRLLMDIATRMPDRREIDSLMAQLREIQKSVNSCVWGIYLVALIAAAIWGQLFWR